VIVDKTLTPAQRRTCADQSGGSCYSVIPKSNTKLNPNHNHNSNPKNNLKLKTNPNPNFQNIVEKKTVKNVENQSPKPRPTQCNANTLPLSHCGT